MRCSRSPWAARIAIRRPWRRSAQGGRHPPPGRARSHAARRAASRARAAQDRRLRRVLRERGLSNVQPRRAACRRQLGLPPGLRSCWLQLLPRLPPTVRAVRGLQRRRGFHRAAGGAGRAARGALAAARRCTSITACIRTRARWARALPRASARACGVPLRSAACCAWRAAAGSRWRRGARRRAMRRWPRRFGPARCCSPPTTRRISSRPCCCSCCAARGCAGLAAMPAVAPLRRRAAGAAAAARCARAQLRAWVQRARAALDRGSDATPMSAWIATTCAAQVLPPIVARWPARRGTWRAARATPPRRSALLDALARGRCRRARATARRCR